MKDINNIRNKTNIAVSDKLSRRWPSLCARVNFDFFVELVNTGACRETVCMYGNWRGTNARMEHNTFRLSTPANGALLLDRPANAKKGGVNFAASFSLLCDHLGDLVHSWRCPAEGFIFLIVCGQYFKLTRINSSCVQL